MSLQNSELKKKTNRLSKDGWYDMSGLQLHFSVNRIGLEKWVSTVQNTFEQPRRNDVYHFTNATDTLLSEWLPCTPINLNWIFAVQIDSG